MERLRRAGDRPLAVDRVWLPAEVGGPLLGADWSRTSLYARLAETGVGRPDSGWGASGPFSRPRRTRGDSGSTRPSRCSASSAWAVWATGRWNGVAASCADRFAVMSTFEGGRTEASLRLSTFSPRER
ncbi:MAG: UTRA domain-containing protein [Microthrixaceae bacterium]